MRDQTWIEPGAHIVTPGVWRIPLPLPSDGLRAVNVYAIEDSTGFTLIDGGWALDVARDALTKAMADLGGGLGDITRFLVTHAHRDHYTQAVTIRREFGTRVLIGSGERGTIELLTKPDHPGFRAQIVGLARHGAASIIEAIDALDLPPEPEDIGYEAPDAYVASGERFAIGDRVIEAIATPGHTTGHVVYVDHAAGLMFAGDHVLPHITPSVAFEPNPPDLALRDYLASLRLVRGMPDMALLPAHGPVADRMHERIDELLAHHASRLAEMLRVLDGDGHSAFEVASEVGWTSRKRKLTELDPFNQMLATFESVLHLDLLVAQGLAAVAEVDGVRTFTRL